MPKQQTNEIFPRSRLKFVAVVFAIFFLLVSMFLFRWQVLEHSRFSSLAASRTIKQEIPTVRGDILAADGSVLSYSEPRFDVFVYMDDKLGLVAAENNGRQTREEFVRKVAPVINIDPAQLASLLDKSTTSWLRISQWVTKEQRDALYALATDKDINLRLDGINFENTSVRIYPEGTMSAHVLGFVGRDDQGNEVGRNGLEQYFDGVLKPLSGISTIEADSNQNLIAIGDNTLGNARRGATLKTTINKTIQVKVENQLKLAVDKYRAVSGTVIVVDPRTGEIISMASYPNYSPQDYKSVKSSKDFGNLAITNPYEIGSVGKIYTMSAAVDQGKVTPDTIVINGHKGCMKIVDDRPICTYDKKPQPALTATEAMIKSDNLALFATAELIGQEKLIEYLEKFGMGKRTDVRLSGEDSGFIKPGSKWNQADLAAAAYGHGYYQTSLQAAMGVSVLANSGVLMQPLIVKEQIEADGTKKTYTSKAVAQVLKPESARIMGQMLHQVYLSNLAEARYKDLAKYNIGMKSGTALIPFVALNEPKSQPGYSSEVIATYVGYDASYKNSFLMLVNLFEPQTANKLSYYSSRYLWLDIFRDIKDDLGVPSE